MLLCPLNPPISYSSTSLSILKFFKYIAKLLQIYTQEISGVATLGPTGVLVLPSASVAPPSVFQLIM